VRPITAARTFFADQQLATPRSSSLLGGLTWDPASLGLPGPLFLRAMRAAQRRTLRCRIMSPHPWTLAFIACAAVLLPGPTMAAPPVTIARMRWNARPLLVFGSAGDPRLIKQRAILAAQPEAVAERDVKVVEIVDADVRGTSEAAAALRARYRVADGFAVILIGKDGGEKLRSAEPIPAERLFATIDAMPMRQSEARR
jgi:hypothetical protein